MTDAMAMVPPSQYFLELFWRMPHRDRLVKWREGLLCRSTGARLSNVSGGRSRIGLGQRDLCRSSLRIESIEAFDQGLAGEWHPHCCSCVRGRHSSFSSGIFTIPFRECPDNPSLRASASIVFPSSLVLLFIGWPG